MLQEPITSKKHMNHATPPEFLFYLYNTQDEDVLGWSNLPTPWDNARTSMILYLNNLGNDKALACIFGKNQIILVEICHDFLRTYRNS